MKHKKGAAFIIFILIFGAPCMAASAFLGFGNTASWKEEVLLHDGGKIVVERFYHLGGKPTLESRERRALDETASFELPGAQERVIWKTEFNDSVPDPNSLNLLVLGIVGGTPYLATYPVGCISYNKWGRPNPPYIFFRYDGDDWKKIPLEEFPPELSKVNVIVGRPPAKLLKPFYTIEQVKEQNRNIHTERYRTIIRTPFDPKALEKGCPVLVRKKDGWYSPRGPKAPHPIQPKQSENKTGSK